MVDKWWDFLSGFERETSMKFKEDLLGYETSPLIMDETAYRYLMAATSNADWSQRYTTGTGTFARGGNDRIRMQCTLWLVKGHDDGP